MRGMIFASKGRCGRPVRYKNLVFYACEGLIVCQDERPGDTGKGDWQVITPTDLEARVKHMAAADRGFRGSQYASNVQRPWMRQEANIRLRALQELTDVIAEARRMGDPSDPAVQAFWRRHYRPGSVALSTRASSDPDSYPELPDIDLGPFTGRVCDSDGVADPVPNYHSRDFALYVPAHRKNRTGIILGK